MVEYSEENMNKLAQKVVEGWDINTLMQYAIDQVEENYKNNKGDFEGDLEYYLDMK